MAKSEKIEPGTYFKWIDYDHFVFGDNWYRVVGVTERGRIRGETYFIDAEKSEFVVGRVVTDRVPKRFEQRPAKPSIDKAKEENLTPQTSQD